MIGAHAAGPVTAVEPPGNDHVVSSKLGHAHPAHRRQMIARVVAGHPQQRSEERRVGKSVDLGGRRIMKKKKSRESERTRSNSEEARSAAKQSSNNDERL